MAATRMLSLRLLQPTLSTTAAAAGIRHHSFSTISYSRKLLSHAGVNARLAPLLLRKPAVYATAHPLISSSRFATYAVPPATTASHAGTRLGLIPEEVGSSSKATRRTSPSLLEVSPTALPPYFAERLASLSSLPTIPQIRSALDHHAVDTYKGVGFVAFDEKDERTVAEGADTAILPLSTDRDLRFAYTTHRGTVRYGRLLEQLDLFATWLGYKHNQRPNVPIFTAGPAHHTIGVVTALVDSVTIHKPWVPPISDRDIFYHGYTTWVGKSSSEVVVHILQQQTATSNEGGDSGSPSGFRTLATAKFVMVTLGADLRSAPNVRLAIGEENGEMERFREAEKRKQLRQVERERLQAPAEGAELAHLSQLSLFKLLGGGGSDSGGKIVRPMRECVYESSHQCFPVERNLHGKIFGGYLMRRAFEVAFTNVGYFIGPHIYPQLVHVSDLRFERPVDMGSVLMLSSQVCYSEGRFIHCRVEGRTETKKKVKKSVENKEGGGAPSDDVEEEEETSTQLNNTFNFTFAVPEGKVVPQVVPSTSAEAARYLSAKRLVESTVGAAAATS